MAYFSLITNNNTDTLAYWITILPIGEPEL